MKKLFKLCLAACAMLLTAQPSQAQYVSNNNEDGVYRVQKGAPRYVEGEVIVKFKDSEQVAIRRNAKGRFESASVSKVNAKLQEMGTFEMEQLMPLTGGKVKKGMRKAISSNRILKDVDLSQLYAVRFDKEKMSVDEAVEQLRQLDNVEYATPNMIFTICEEGPTTYSDPLYSQQWGLPAINMPKVWGLPKASNRRPVIAILDTGVDIEHPDLKDNIWTNTLEAEGDENADDDNNGYRDDIHGWDFIMDVPIFASERFGRDKNGHGTHCAGIAAAVGNNGIGVAGANPDALIMPIKVMSDEGIGDAANMLKGIDYAIANGADVISMSLGANVEIYSKIEFDLMFVYSALQKAYMNDVFPVAAAGNNGLSIYESSSQKSGLNVPAAFDCVVGVMASDKYSNIASFSNFDPDGAFYTEFINHLGESDLCLNYDVIAPGVDIVSTYPGGGYKTLSGTSMACPLVAGALSRIIQARGEEYLHDDSWMGDVQSAVSEGSHVFDAFKVCSFDSENRQSLVYFTTIDARNQDGKAEINAGDVVSIYPVVRCLWGTVHDISVHVGVKNSKYRDLAEIVQNDVAIGNSLSAGGSIRFSDPVILKLSPEIKDKSTITLEFTLSGGNMLEPVSREVAIEVVNASRFAGLVDGTVEISANRRNLIERNLAILENATLIIKPGSTVDFQGPVGISCNGTIIAEGTPDSMIVITGTKNTHVLELNSNCKFKYVKFTDAGYKINGQGSFEDCVFENAVNWQSGRLSSFKNCVFNNISGADLLQLMGSLVGCNFVNLSKVEVGYQTWEDQILENSNFIAAPNALSIYSYVQPSVIKLEPNYYGSSKESSARNSVILDIYNPNYYGYGAFNLSNMLTRPSAQAHGIVWKVCVDGKDAQDEFDEMPALSIGRHKFEVYFNRPMNKEVKPCVTMGLRAPYNQLPIAEDGAWNEDGTIYTAYLTLTGKSAVDGLDRIVVSGAEDNEHFACPIENTRFNVMVQVVGSLSTGLVAKAGLGKVELEWETDEADFADLMGYNLYRYNEREEKYIEWGKNDNGEWGNWEKTRILVDTIKVNDMLIEPGTTTLTDYNVEPGTTYYYYIMEMGTDLQQHDVSKVVAATPLTATKGDANGSMNVDIADVVTEVNYLTGQNPQPFIFEAADVNSDETVNILDVVGTVNIIITPKGAATASTDAKATYTVENGILYVDSDTPLGGVQVSIKANANTVFEALEGLDGMEQAGVWVAEDEYMLLAYSMSGRVIGSGKQALVRIGDAEVTDVVASDAKGHNVLAINGTATSIASLPFGIENYEGAEVRYYDLTGRRVSAEAARKSGVAIQSLFIDGKCVKSYKILNR